MQFLVNSTVSCEWPTLPESNPYDIACAHHTSPILIQFRRSFRFCAMIFWSSVSGSFHFTDPAYVTAVRPRQPSGGLLLHRGQGMMPSISPLCRRPASALDIDSPRASKTAARPTRSHQSSLPVQRTQRLYVCLLSSPDIACYATVARTLLSHTYTRHIHADHTTSANARAHTNQQLNQFAADTTQRRKCSDVHVRTPRLFAHDACRTGRGWWPCWSSHHLG